MDDVTVEAKGSNSTSTLVLQVPGVRPHLLITQGPADHSGLWGAGVEHDV